MVVSKDNNKPNNNVMNSLQYVNGKGKNNRLAKERFLEESEDNPNTSRRLLNSNSYQTIDPNVKKSYALPSRDAFLSVNMKIDRKRHQEISQPFLNFATNSLSALERKQS